MKSLQITLAALISAAVILSSCKTWNNTQKGTAIGAGGGAAAGAVVGKIAGNTALGAIIGAAVGGTAGAVIGHKMDKQAAEIKDQIPDAKVERVGEGIEVEFNNKIMFGFDKSDLGPTAQSNLNELVTILTKYPDTNIEVQGHTDSTGTDAYNMGLSERRAGVVADYLKSKGVAASRVTTKGFGKTAPKYPNSTEEGRAQNRRVEFLITANDKMKSDAKQQSN
ncbi:OmpA family protein [Deminuibacter soli]|uniref:OmpA family protein n=1 Tax=Deminuibacter soli TaxID=2291815 RepID=A0A3E1NRL9_9BACT|nr:OmpA family protein [Deminuibacter soli]RFM30575.1 OmpA family protein [Deminuibacter soli]